MNIYTQFAQTSPSNASAPQTQRHQAAGICPERPWWRKHRCPGNCRKSWRSCAAANSDSDEATKGRCVGQRAKQGGDFKILGTCMVRPIAEVVGQLKNGPKFLLYSIREQPCTLQTTQYTLRQLVSLWSLVWSLLAIAKTKAAMGLEGLILRSYLGRQKRSRYWRFEFAFISWQTEEVQILKV